MTKFTDRLAIIAIIAIAAAYIAAQWWLELHWETLS